MDGPDERRLRDSLAEARRRAQQFRQRENLAKQNLARESAAVNLTMQQVDDEFARLTHKMSMSMPTTTRVDDADVDAAEGQVTELKRRLRAAKDVLGAQKKILNQLQRRLPPKKPAGSKRLSGDEQSHMVARFEANGAQRRARAKMAIEKTARDIDAAASAGAPKLSREAQAAALQRLERHGQEKQARLQKEREEAIARTVALASPRQRLSPRDQAGVVSRFDGYAAKRRAKKEASQWRHASPPAREPASPRAKVRSSETVTSALSSLVEAEASN